MAGPSPAMQAWISAWSRRPKSWPVIRSSQLGSPWVVRKACRALMGTSGKKVEGEVDGDAGAGFGALQRGGQFHEVRADPGLGPFGRGVDQAQRLVKTQAAWHGFGHRGHEDRIEGVQV